MQKACVVCGDAFEARGSAKYCGPACRRKRAAEKQREYIRRVLATDSEAYWAKERARRKRYRLRHLDEQRLKSRESMREYREKKRAEYNDYHREYYRANRDRIRQQQNASRRAKKASA